MADIFNRDNDAYGGSFSSDSASVTFPAAFGGGGAGGGVGLLTQQLGINYQQQVTKVYEIGTNLCYYVGGRTQGQASIQRIIGPRPVLAAFYQKFGDICNVFENHFSLSMAAGCKTAVAGGASGANPAFVNAPANKYNVLYALAASIGMNLTAQDMMVNEQLQVMFAALTMTENSQVQAAAQTGNAFQTALTAAAGVGGQILSGLGLN